MEDMASLIGAVTYFGLWRALCFFALVAAIQVSAQRFLSRGLAVRRREIIEDLKSAGDLPEQGDLSERKTEIIDLLYDDLRSLIVSAHKRKSFYLNVVRSFRITVVFLAASVVSVLAYLFEGEVAAGQISLLIPLLKLFAFCFFADIILDTIMWLVERVVLCAWQKSKMIYLNKKLSIEEKELFGLGKQLGAIDSELEGLEMNYSEPHSKALQGRLKELGFDLKYISSMLHEKRVRLRKQKTNLTDDIDRSEAGLTKDVAHDYRKSLIAFCDCCLALLHEIDQLECYLGSLQTDIAHFASN